MNKKTLKTTEVFADPRRIADLKSAVENLVSHRKKPEELDGIIADAKTLAREWKNPYSGRTPKDRRPLFDDAALNTNVLLAALVVALRPYYERLEPILRLAPNELENASVVARKPLYDQVVAGVPKRTAKQKSEDKRRRWHRNFHNSIEYQFGNAAEAERRKWLAGPSNLPPLDLRIFAGRRAPRIQKPRTLARKPTRLDGIFVGQTVNMQRLEELFDTGRHYLSAILQGSHKPPYNYLDVVKIMDALLCEKPRKRRKKATAGRPSRSPWLNDADLRVRVLKAIEARIATIAAALRESYPDIAQRWQREFADPFLVVVRRHLPDSGKK